jgi:hypothetical protein
MFRYISLSIIILISTAASAQTVNNAQFRSDLLFIENKGQVVDQNGNPRNDIDFKIAGKGLNIFIGHGQIHYQFNKKKDSTAISYYRMDVTLKGADQDAELITEQEQDYYETYYTGQCWSNGKGTIAHTCKKITYKNIYNNIDWVLYIKNNRLEYDFIVHDGGDAKDIQMEYNGATNIAAAINGSVHVTCPMGNVIEDKPNSYELKTGKNIATSFEINNNILRFKPENYKGGLVIDPSLTWATYYGGTVADNAYSVACDDSGFVFMAGEAGNNSNLATTGAYQSTLYYSYDAYIVKFNSSGSRLWGTYYGDYTNNNYSLSGLYYPRELEIASDQNGNVYITGSTTSSNYIATTGSYQSTFAGDTDVYLAKFNGSGALKWATYFGGRKKDVGTSVACDKFGHVFITGFTKSDTGIATPGAFQEQIGGSTVRYYDIDCFLAKFDTSGNLKWATYYGGKNDDGAYGISCDNIGDAYICGVTNSDSGIATSGSFISVHHYSSVYWVTSCFLAKFDSSGQRNWGTYLDDGFTSNHVSSLACDTTNCVYVCGTTLMPSTSYPIVTSTIFSSPDHSGFLTKFSNSGSHLWGINYGGFDGYDYSVACDKLNTVYLAGTPSYNDTTVATAGSYQSSLAGETDAYVARFTSNGQRLWGTYYGGSAEDDEYGLATDNFGAVYLCGSTTSIDSIATSGAYQDSIWGATGNTNAFLAKFNTDTLVFINQPYNDTVLCKGGTYNVNYSVSYAFRSGNSFTVQLSDSSGSFASPTAIGTKSATTSGSISCTIPSGTVQGVHYRIRIVATKPACTSPDDYYNINIIQGINPVTAGTNAPVCLGDTLKLYSNSGTPGIHYTWTGPSAYTSNFQNTIIKNATTANSGAYIITGSANSCNSESDTIFASVRIPPPPTLNSNSPVCYKDSLKLKASDSVVGVIYHWLTPDSLSTTKQNPILYYAPPGYYLCWVSLPHCNSPVNFTYVSISTPSAPSVSITSNPFVYTSGSSVQFTAHPVGGGPGPNYQWRKNGVDISGATTNPFTTSSLKSGDIISVVMYSSSPCDSPNYAIGSLAPLGIVNNPGRSGIAIYPNPTTNSFEIQNAAGSQFQLTDLTGKVLMQGQIASVKQEVNISTLKQGIYFVYIISENWNKQSFKLIKN